ncbi:MAG: stage IV sporulation protein A [Clostridia bacterium]|nr:stage IV sporulation protein A [Clostridia bacterium]
MTSENIYNSIASRTGGDIYIGVVGPVRTGKSTFIKRFMDVLVLPNISDESKKERAKDELPQSSSGRTIMTTEPKFIPEDAAEVTADDSMRFRVRLIDCVGYIVPGSLGYIENDQPRMVKTPWFEKEVPFNMAAEIGTKKVIDEHSTIGLVVTTDGTIGDIERRDYEQAEERVINELKAIKKPFVVLLNSKNPESDECKKLSQELSKKYEVSVIAVNCVKLTELEIKNILANLLYEFPIKELRLNFPKWITQLEKEHPLRQSLYSGIINSAGNLRKVKDAKSFVSDIASGENICNCKIADADLSCGSVKVALDVESTLFYKVMSEKTGLDIKDEQQLMAELVALAKAKKDFERFRLALDEVEATGYGIVMPTMDELSLDDPEIMKQGGKYGVRLKASAPSIHMLKANITTEVAPIVGTESQSEELIMYLLKEFEEDPSKIWQSNIFGKTLDSLVNEGLHNKLYKMPTDARMKLQETLERVINEGCSGLICIIL